MSLPCVDVSPLLVADPLLATTDDHRRVGQAIGHACREHGFFTLTGHGVDAGLQARLAKSASRFFARPEAEKARVAMALSGLAWRGWFPVGGELTSGRPDRKEGLYFGRELPPDNPLVRAGTPLHGPNPFLDEDADFRADVLAYMDALTYLGHRLTAGIALALGLEATHFAKAFLRDPLTLFRIFHYPPPPVQAGTDDWGVGAHTDYGFLTILLQDDAGGLQVQTGDSWIDVPPPDASGEGAYVCNIGDMLDRLTGGVFRSTLHRVRNTSGRSRLSFPFFFDPGFFAVVDPLPGFQAAEDSDTRWDGIDVRADVGTYGEYLLRKVSKVFPELASGVKLF